MAFKNSQYPFDFLSPKVMVGFPLTPSPDALSWKIWKNESAGCTVDERKNHQA